MLRKVGGVMMVACVTAVGLAQAQATFMPSYNAPYRAFARHEFGGTLSFPSPGDFALEGQYRFGYKNWDIGFRAGWFDPGGVADNPVLVGVEGRARVLTHTPDFPLDGAVIVGIGGWLVEDFSTLFVPVGLSLGRRLDVEGSQVSIIPYAQPTMWLVANDFDTDLEFALGLGADFRLSRVFDARVSFSLGDNEGVSISAVWVR